MLKYLLLVAANTFLLNTAICQKADTTVIYLKYGNYGTVFKANNIEEADFYRLILAPDSGDDLKNVKEYYKNGQVKLIGKISSKDNGNEPTGRIFFSGDCISFYPNGKKLSMTHFIHGEKDGNEYIFYPNGTIYCYRKNKSTYANGFYSLETKNWECYDLNGIKICNEGTGQWIEYDAFFKKIMANGPIKNGIADGEWHYLSNDADSINYSCKYKKGVFVSGIGYDKAGKAYPFIQKAEWANYKGGAVEFVEEFKQHLKLPRGVDGRKMSVDTIHINLIVEKDGSVTGFKTQENINPDLNNALSQALEKCRNWTPSKLYGVPLRTEIILPLNITEGFNALSYDKRISFKIRIIGD